jgi:precorrin-2 methylase
MGWSGNKNGELLLLMSQEGFTILLATDQNLRYQQNLQQAGVAVVVLVASSNCDTIISETEKKCITINSPLKY